MSTSRLFWFFVWRTALLGAACCAAVLAATAVFPLVANALITDAPRTGANVGAGLFWLVGSGLVFGVVGAVVGLGLGLLCGPLLFALTRALYYPRPADARGYRKSAGRTCAAVSVLALLGDWTIYSLLGPHSRFLDPDAFILSRFFGGFSLYSVTASHITFVVLVPTLLLALAVWLSGRKLAGWYLSKSAETEHEGRQATSIERPGTG